MSKVHFIYILIALGFTGKIANAFRSYGSYPYPRNEHCVMILVNGEGNYFASRCNQAVQNEGCSVVPGDPNGYYPACCPQSTCNSNNHNTGSGYSYGMYPATNPANPAPVASQTTPQKTSRMRHRRRDHRHHRRPYNRPSTTSQSPAAYGPSPNAPSAPVPSAPASSPFIMPAMYATECVDVTQMGPGDYVATHCPPITPKPGCVTEPGPQGVYYPACCPSQKCS